MTLGEKIRKYRILKGLTQAQLGSMVKLTGDRIRQYENDIRSPKDGKLMEIADALEINPTTLFDSNYNEPNSVMHTFFELEDIYGMHFEKIGDNYQLAFSKGDDYQNPSWILEGIAAWVKKRNEVQPDINDSASTITDKKNEYITWKARYPYNFRDDIANNFALVNKFNEEAVSLISPNRKSIIRFSEFYKNLLTFESAQIKFTISVDEITNERCALFNIELDYIRNASLDIKKAYMNFRQCWYDMKDIGIKVYENPVPIDGIINISLYTPCVQIITLFHAHMRLTKEKASSLFDEDTFQFKIEDTIRTFDVPIKEYV